MPKNQPQAPRPQQEKAIGRYGAGRFPIREHAGKDGSDYLGALAPRAQALNSPLAGGDRGRLHARDEQAERGRGEGSHQPGTQPWMSSSRDTAPSAAPTAIQSNTPREHPILAAVDRLHGAQGLRGQKVEQLDDQAEAGDRPRRKDEGLRGARSATGAHEHRGCELSDERRRRGSRRRN